MITPTKKPRRKHAKWTLKKQSQEFFIFIQVMKSYANKLDYVCKDDDYHEGQSIAKDIMQECEEKLQYL